MRAPMARVVLWTWIVGLIGCANIWGFTDFTLDATTADGSGDAPFEGDTSIADSADSRLEAGGGADADASIGSDASDAEAEAEAECGSTTTVTSCGACGNACDLNNASSVGCAGSGTCTYSCMPGFANCDASPPNTYGCETQTNAPSNCSGCGLACDTKHSIDAGCSTGVTCIYAGCMPNYFDCDTTPPDLNGCETHVGGSAGCGVCDSGGCDTDSGHSIGATCDGSTCFYSGCAPGWADCNPTPPDTHGCNTLLTSPSNCGACGAACDTRHSVDAGCDDAGCNYVGCTAGWANCDKTPPDTNGCETWLSSTSNCGMCGHACDTTTGTPACDGGTCSYTCNAGRADCDAAPPNLDGCECPTAVCCPGAMCQTLHGNGVGQPFYDCVKQGQIDQTQATEACTAFTQNGSLCAASSNSLCLGGLLGGQTTAYSVCSSAPTCYCWQYNGTYAGHVQSGSCTVTCGSSSDPTWN
jgi:hypothetical protein